MAHVALAALFWAPSAAQTASTQAVAAQLSARPIGLEEAYALALQRSEALAQDAESYRQALARVDELKADIMPHVNLIGSHAVQQSPHSGISSIDRTEIPEAQITATQPLFSGFREFLAFKAGKKQAEAARLTEQRAQSLLYRDVVAAYLDLLRLQQEIEIRRSIMGATEDRIRQLEQWLRIGRSRESEALAARSQLAQVEADLEIARGLEQVSQETLRFLTGLEDVDLAPQPQPLDPPRPIDLFLARAGQRDDVEAARRNLEYSELSTEISRRQRWPTVGLTADYYLKRVGFQGNVHYDALVSGSLPIFDGGVITAQVREARAAERSSAQALSLASRTARREVRAAYRNLVWSLSSVEALSKAAQLAQANVQAQEQDYRLSLVTNLEVLDSLNALESTRLALSTARQQAVLAQAELEVAAGGPRRPAGALTR